MKFLFILAFALAAGSSVQATEIACLKTAPNWQPIMGGKLGHQGFGSALVINLAAKQVTWVGSSSYINVTGERNSRGVMITRIDGQTTREKITRQRQIGNILDLELADSLGGVGLLRVSLDKNGNGQASWQHATAGEREELSYCTTNVRE